MSTSIYTPDFVGIARTLIARGALDRELACAFGVHVKTVQQWKLAHPDFAAATRLGKEEAVRAVENALFRRATGYSFESERVFCSPKDGTITRAATVEHVPPCDRAMIVWLKARRPEVWDSPEQAPGHETLEQQLVEFTHSRANLAALWEDDPFVPGHGPIARHLLEPEKWIDPPPGPEAGDEPQDDAAADGAAERESEDAPPDPLADPRLWPATLAEVDAPLPAEPATGRYHSSFGARARALARNGALDRDLAEAFGVHPGTLQRWKLRHPAFAAAVALGKEVADDAVERALFQKATGYSYESERIFCHEGRISRATVQVQLPPSPAAARFWLEGRGRRLWREEQPDPFAISRREDEVVRQRLRQADLVAYKAWQQGMRGRDLQRHVLEWFGVTEGT